MFNMSMGNMGIPNGFLGGGILGVSAAVAAAYSTRKLNSNYSGSAIRVRRNSDNLEADIGFSAAGDLDVFGLMNHVGAENLLTYSEQFDNAAWVHDSDTVVPNAAIAPDGTLTAGIWTINTSGNVRRQSVTKTAVDIAYTGSLWVKNLTGTGSMQVRLVSNGSIIAASVFSPNLSSGAWVRVPTASATSGAFTAVRFDLVGLNAGDTFAIWGAQLNRGSTPLDYCRTVASPTVSGQNLLLNSDAPATQTVTLTLGSTYTLSCTGVGGDSITSSAGTAGGSGFGAAVPGTPNTFTVTTAGTVVLTKAGSPTTEQLNMGSVVLPHTVTTGVMVDTGSGFITKVYDQSLFNNPELVMNGTFNSNVTGWSAPAAFPSTASSVSGEMQVTASGANGKQQCSVTTVSGKTYTVTALCRRISGTGLVYIHQGLNDGLGSSAGNASGTNNSSTASLLSFTFTASATTSYIDCVATVSGDVGGFDNISVKENRDLLQATAAKQPRIVFAGTIDRITTAVNHPAFRTDGVSQCLQTGSFVLAQPLTRSSVLYFSNIAAAQKMLSGSNISPDNELYFSGSGSLASYAGTTVSVKTGISVNDKATIVETQNGANSNLSYNGANATANIGTNGIDGVTVGNWNTGYGNALFGDILIFPSALSTQDRQALEANQKSYWGTP